MLKKILNLHEEATHSRLKDACNDWEASVYSKIRLADIFPIEGSGISDKDFRFALQSHFDFVISNKKHDPLFAIEFDGHSHRKHTQIQRDKLKNQLCERFDLPLLRITSNFLQKKYRNMDVLTWLVEVWFLQEGFYDAQSKGQIPPDEPFDPLNFIMFPKSKERFPLWLSLNSNIKIKKLFENKLCKDPIPSVFIGRDKENNYKGIAFIRINDERGVCTRITMLKQQFSVGMLDILNEILICELYEKVKKAIKDIKNAESLNQIIDRCNYYQNNYERYYVSTYGDSFVKK